MNFNVLLGGLPTGGLSKQCLSMRSEMMSRLPNYLEAPLQLQQLRRGLVEECPAARPVSDLPADLQSCPGPYP